MAVRRSWFRVLLCASLCLGAVLSFAPLPGLESDYRVVNGSFPGKPVEVAGQVRTITPFAVELKLASGTCAVRVVSASGRVNYSISGRQLTRGDTLPAGAKLVLEPSSDASGSYHIRTGALSADVIAAIRHGMLFACLAGLAAVLILPGLTAPHPRRTRVESKIAPSVVRANLLLLTTTLLMLAAARFFYTWRMPAGLACTEVLFILAPMLLFARAERRPLRETLRLRWPGAQVAAWSVIIGIGTWPVCTLLYGMTRAVVGYDVAVLVPGVTPGSPAEAVLFFIALTALPAICEELLFRGYIQPAYEIRAGWRGVLAASGLFVLYHLSFSRLLSLVPLALLLGFLAWRTGSTVPGMFAHFGANSVAASLAIIMGLGFATPPWAIAIGVIGIVIGPIVAFYGLRRIWRQTAPPQPPIQPPHGGWARQVWPVAAFAALWGICAGVEFVDGRFPRVFAIREPAFRSEAWARPTEWNYALLDPKGVHAGTATCAVRPEAQVYALTCEVRQVGDLRQTVRWERNGMRLIESSSVQTGAASRRIDVRSNGEGLLLRVETGGEQQEKVLPRHATLRGEWPWRMAASARWDDFTSFLPGRSFAVTLASPGESTEDALITIGAVEYIRTPAGRFEAWRVSAGKQTAWYDVRSPHTLVAYDDGTFKYLLTGSAGAL